MNRTYQVGKSFVGLTVVLGLALGRPIAGCVDSGRLLRCRCGGRCGGGVGNLNLLSREGRRTFETGEGRSGREKVEGGVAALLRVAAGRGRRGVLRDLDLARLAVVLGHLGPRGLLLEEVRVGHGSLCFCAVFLRASFSCASPLRSAQ